MSGSFASSNVAPSNLDELKRWLEQMVKQLAFVRLVAAIVALVSRLTDINAELAKQLANLRRARPRSERWRAIEAQLAFTWTVAGAPAAAAPASDKPEPSTTGEQGEKKAPKKRSRKGQHPRRQAFPSDLKRVPQYNGVPPELRRCPKCGLEMGRMGHTHCEYLEVKPAEVFVVRRSDEAVRCALDGTIVSAPPPPRIVERGVLGNRLIIEATADKFLDHLPIERQCLRYARSGVDIAPQTLGRCVGAHIDLLAPLAHAIIDKTRGAGLLATDATSLPILDPESPQGIRSGTLWAWTNALWVSFVYSPNASAESVKRFLGEGNYARTVQADGTNLLTFIERAGGRRPGCWSHGRRGLVLCARSGDRVALDGNSDRRAQSGPSSAASRREDRLLPCLEKPCTLMTKLRSALP